MTKKRKWFHTDGCKATNIAGRPHGLDRCVISQEVPDGPFSMELHLTDGCVRQSWNMTIQEAGEEFQRLLGAVFTFDTPTVVWPQ